MKKTLIILSVITSLLGGNAYAKTEGNYVGFNLLRSSVDNKYKLYDESSEKFSDSSIGFGLDYKYAFNFNNFYVAPGVFGEKIGTRAKDSEGDPVSLDYRYGAKFDIGYDVIDNFAIYFTNGLAATAGKVDWKSTGQKKSSTELDYFYGAGVVYKVTKDFAINLEYNAQKSNFKTPLFDNISADTEAKLNVIKLGASYHF